MVGLAASNAFLNRDRLLTQHQAALTLLQRLLANPEVTAFQWLDLACGKGQILAHLDENLSQEQRSKVAFFGYDLNVEYGRLTERRSSQLAFNGATVIVGDLLDFSSIIDNHLYFDFITLTNAVHEIGPGCFSTVLVDCISRLTQDGSLFIYDMENLPSPELGAVPWKASEVKEILRAILHALGVNNYRPAIGRWMHQSCAGWNALIEKRHIIREAGDMITQSGGPMLSRQHAVSCGEAAISEIMIRRAFDCRAMLESLTRFGSATEKEKTEEIVALYEYWALTRALGRAS